MAAVVDRPAQDPALLNVITEGEGPPPRIGVLDVSLVSRSSPDQLAQELHGRFGDEPLDFAVLERPVALGADWRDNNLDHGARLLAAWAVLEGLVEAGAARALGVGRAAEAVLALLAERAAVAPALTLIEQHPFLRSDGLVERLAERGVAAYGLQPLGPISDGAAGYQALEHPVVAEIAGRHGRSPAEVVLRWGLGRLDGLVLDIAEAEAAGSLEQLPALGLNDEEAAALDGLDCGFRIDASPSTLAALHGYLSSAPMRTEPAPTEGFEVGCHKILYAPVSGNESFNRRFSFFVWRNVFNLPATVSYSRAGHRLSPVSERIHADLNRDGFATTNVDELACADVFERVQADAAALVERVRRQEEAGNHPLYRYVSKGDGAQELAQVRNLTDAIDAYCGLRTVIDDVSVITIPGRLTTARKQQLWHSDVEDLLTVKAYTFLTDVDGFSGPLDYIAETHPKGRFAVETAELWKRSFVQDPTPTYSFQVPDELLFRHIRPDLLQRLQGPAGTVVIFDARGLHRGGHVLQGLRQVVVTSHTAPNQIHPWRGEKSVWRSLWYPFRWETNVTLRAGATPLPKRLGRALLRRPEEHTKQ